jgi:hypothetical protein
VSARSNEWFDSYHAINDAIAAVKNEVAACSSRELSLALTKLQEAWLWHNEAGEQSR